MNGIIPVSSTVSIVVEALLLLTIVWMICPFAQNLSARLLQEGGEEEHKKKLIYRRPPTQTNSIIIVFVSDQKYPQSQQPAQQLLVVTTVTVLLSSGLSHTTGILHNTRTAVLSCYL